jgi:hypothetical protein
MNKLIAEFIGTFALVFAGAGAIIIDGVSDGAVTHVGIALTFGLVVMVMVMAIGDVSGAHINPAVTIAFWASGRFPAKSVGPYVAAQVAGAFAASMVHRLMFPDDRKLGATIPDGSDLQSFVLEFFMQGEGARRGHRNRRRDRRRCDVRRTDLGSFDESGSLLGTRGDLRPPRLDLGLSGRAGFGRARSDSLLAPHPANQEIDSAHPEFGWAGE